MKDIATFVFAALITLAVFAAFLPLFLNDTSEAGPSKVKCQSYSIDESYRIPGSYVSSSIYKCRFGGSVCFVTDSGGISCQ